MKNITTTATPSTRSRRRLRRAAGSVLASSLIVLGAAACQPTGCQLDCITTVALDPAATKASVTTTVPTTAVIQLYTDQAMTKLAAQQASTTATTTHAIPVGQLNSAATYWWKLTATDANKVARTETGAITTFRRQVAVKITRIQLIDDSDSLGTGEIVFHLKANGTEFENVYVNGDLGSGADLKNLSITRTLPSSNRTLNLAVLGADDDDDIFDIGSLQTGGSGITWGNGSNTHADWATATAAPITLPASAGSGAWTASTTAHAIRFTITGTWTVSYHAL